MDVGVEGIGHIVVKNVRNAINIDSASRDIGCDKNGVVTLTKSL
jgi:hypothetical protein